MRSIADGNLDATKAFGDEMYFCLGCLACETACPAGVDYTHLFEVARAEVERSGVLANPQREVIRNSVLRILFTQPPLLRALGRTLRFYQQSGLQQVVRNAGLTKLLPLRYRNLEKQTPEVRDAFSDELIATVERPFSEAGAEGKGRRRVGLLTGCVQDVIFSEVNRDTADVLLANGCEVYTPNEQFCCGSLHGHNGDLKTARELARRNIDLFDVEGLDAIITNAAGCGSHLKHYDRLLEGDTQYYARAVVWSRKLRDIHEYLAETGFRTPRSATPAGEVSASSCSSVTYHEACHLCHGQKITKQPREVLKAIPGTHLRELGESTWCCGSAGIYNITQPEMSRKLLDRKLGHLKASGASVVATANPGCMLQLINGLREEGSTMQVAHPISLLARAYRAETAAHPGATS